MKENLERRACAIMRRVGCDGGGLIQYSCVGPGVSDALDPRMNVRTHLARMILKAGGVEKVVREFAIKPGD